MKFYKIILISMILILNFSLSDAAQFNSVYKSSVTYFNNYYDFNNTQDSYMAISSVIDTPSFPVIVKNIPDAPGDIKLFYLSGWANFYPHTFVAALRSSDGYPEPGSDYENNEYTFFIDENFNGLLDQGEPTHMFSLPSGSIKNIGFVDNVDINTGNHPTITWEGINQYSNLKYRVLIFTTNTDGYPNLLEPLFISNSIEPESQNSFSYTYSGDLFNLNYVLTIAVEGTEYYEGRILNRSRYFTNHLASIDDDDNDGDNYTKNQGDCNDSDATIYPDAIEICGDGEDQDCDGKDEACIDDTPSIPTGVTASDATLSGKVQVSWTSATGATSYDVYRADMPAWTGTAPKRIASSVSGTSYDDISAADGSRYYYWVKSRNSGGVSKYSNFDAGYWGNPGSIPAVPTNVSATDGTVSGKVNITWTATANTLIYEIWRADIPAFLGGSLKKVATSTSISYDDASAVSGNRYYYWIKSRNSWGVSRYSKFDTGYHGTASSPLPAPTGVTASDGTISGQVRINWNAVSGAALYEVWRAAKLVSEGGKPQRVGFLSGTSFDDTTGSTGTTYYYWVKSRDSWGSSKYSVPDTGYRN